MLETEYFFKKPVSVNLEYACPVETCSEPIAFITQDGSVNCILSDLLFVKEVPEHA